MMKKNSPQLSEKDFFNESYRQDPFPFWFWMAITTAFVLLLFAGYAWYAKLLTGEYRHNPFLQVSNREMSLFLWQDPSFMRANAPAKSAYMPGFQYVEKISLELPFADDYVMAPPEVIFRYHAWHRLVGEEFPQRPIPLNEFKEFLEYAEEWQPQNWPRAPKGYLLIIEHLNRQQNLAAALPLQVRQAFQGWKNFFKEGEAINALQPTVQQVRSFLSRYPQYSRNDWRNIVGFNYLASLSELGLDFDTIIPVNELSSFLRVALYNDLKASQE